MFVYALKIINKSAQKASIFSRKAYYARSLLNHTQFFANFSKCSDSLVDIIEGMSC